MAASSSSSASRKQLARCLSSSLRPTPAAASPASRRLIPVACIHTTTARSLPRAVKRNTSAAPSSSSSSSSSPLPWFLEDQPVVEVDAPPPSTSTPAASSSSSSSTPAEDLPLPPSISTLPIPLALLHTHLFRGPVYGLLHTPDPTLPEEDHLEPWVSIHARALAGSTSWCDWVIIVTVRENNGGAINKRVAEEVGEVLRRARPPRLEEEEGVGVGAGKAIGKASAMLEDLLGPGQSRSPFGPKSEAKGGIRASTPTSPTREGDVDLEQSTPPSWATHRSSLRHKFSSSPLGTTSWRPLKILSRETQNGLRALNASDPTRWRAASIAEYFKISPEAVRRILRADPSRWGGDNKEAGEGARALLGRGEGEMREGKTWEQREMDEIERIRREIEEARRAGGREEVVGVEAELEGEGAAALFEGTSSEPTPPAAASPTPSRSPIDIRSLGKPRHPIRFEGIPASSSSTSSASARRRQQRNAASSSSSDNGSGGEWVLVDAGWCVVHVMTPRARQRYDVEGVWREAERERRRSGGGEAV